MENYLRLPLDMDHVLLNDIGVTRPIDKYAKTILGKWNGLVSQVKIGQPVPPELDIDDQRDIIATTQPGDDVPPALEVSLAQLNQYLEFIALSTEEELIKSGRIKDLDAYSRLAYIHILTILVELSDLYRNDNFDTYHAELGRLLGATNGTFAVEDGIPTIARATILLATSISSVHEGRGDALQKLNLQVTGLNRSVLMNAALWTQVYRAYQQSAILAMDACIWYYNEIYDDLRSIRDELRKSNYTTRTYDLDDTALDAIHGDRRILPTLLSMYFESTSGAPETRTFQPGGSGKLPSHWIRDLLVAVKALVYHVTVYRLRPLLTGGTLNSTLSDLDPAALDMLRQVLYVDFAKTVGVLPAGVTDIASLQKAIDSYNANRSNNEPIKCNLQNALNNDDDYISFLRLAVPDCQGNYFHVKTEILLEYMARAAETVDDNPSTYRGLYKTVADIASTLQGFAGNLDSITRMIRDNDRIIMTESREHNADLYTFVRVRNEGSIGRFEPRRGMKQDSSSAFAVIHHDYVETSSTKMGERGTIIIDDSAAAKAKERDYYHVFGPFTNIFYKAAGDTTSDEADHLKIVNQMGMVKNAIMGGKNACVVLTGPSGSGKSSLGIYLRYFPPGETTPRTAQGILPLLCTQLGQTNSFTHLVVNIVEVIRDPSPNSKPQDCVEVMNLEDDGRGADNWYRRQVYIDHEFQWQGGEWVHILGETDWRPGKTVVAKEGNRPIREFTSETGVKVDILDSNYTLAPFLSFVLTHLRKTQGTTNNPQSSRSHMIVLLRFVKGTRQPTDPHMIMCDLAGVENKFVCSSSKVQQDFVNIKNGNQLVYASYLESRLNDVHEEIKEILGKDIPAPKAPPYPYRIIPNANEYAIEINFDNPDDESNNSKTEWYVPPGRGGMPENHFTETEFNAMLCGYRNLRTHLRIVQQGASDPSSTPAPQPARTGPVAKPAARTGKPVHGRGAGRGIGWASENVVPVLAEVCQPGALHTTNQWYTKELTSSSAPSTTWPNVENIKASELSQDGTVAVQGQVIGSWDTFMKSDNYKQYALLVRVLLRLAQAKKDRKSPLPNLASNPQNSLGAMAWVLGVTRTGPTTDIRPIDRLGATLYSIQEAMKKYSLIASECQLRANEGQYINYSISSLRDFIKTVMRQRNAQPNLYSACSAISNNIYVRDIIEAPLEFGATPPSSIQGIIARRITAVLTGDGENLESQKEVLQKLVLVVFNIVRFVAPQKPYLAPPKAYIEATELELELNRIQSVQQTISSDHTWRGTSGTTGQKLLEYSQVVAPSVWQLLLDRLDNHKYTLSAQMDDMIGNPKYGIRALQQRSLNYTPSDASYHNDVRELLKFIDLSNAETFIGSFEFIDRVSKFGLAKNLCVMPSVERNKDDMLSYANLGMQVEQLRGKILADFQNGIP